MNMAYKKIDETNKHIFHKLMLDYYREGCDENTPQNILDDFIISLYNNIVTKSMYGRLIELDKKIIGFVIWMIDVDGNDYSEMPGYGTIAEIGIKAEYRNQGIGKKIVLFAEKKMMEMGVKGFYVTVYEPATKFWSNCGYTNTHNKGNNNLEIYSKKV
ncbi:MAG: Acetyltransferase domain [Anaerocolumna sp.]|nr:Acetyltransferase domain [Anaerocolumna sp.]